MIGVTHDAKYANLREPAPFTYYLYHFQQSRRMPMMLQFRGSGEPAEYAAAVQRLVREVAPQAQLIGVRRMSDVVDESLVQERFIAQTASAFSLFGLLLACVGLYGVMSYTVTQRTNEIGIRMALGAGRRHVVRLVMREVLLLMALGIGAGLAAALAVTRLATLFTFSSTWRRPIRRPSRWPPCCWPALRHWPVTFPRAVPRGSIRWSRSGTNSQTRSSSALR